MSKKLLALNTYHYRRGGSEAVFFDHNSLFESLGWDVAVFAQHHPLNDPSPWDKYFSDEMEFSEASGIKEKLHMAGKFIYSFEAKNKLEQLLKKFQPDIAHGHLLYHHLSPSVMKLLKDRGVPTVMTAHDLKLACPAYTMLNKNGICEKCINCNLLNVVKNRCIQDNLIQSTLVAVESTVHKSLGLWRKNLDKIVAPSRFHRDKLIEWGWDSSSVEYIPNYIDSNNFTPQYQPGDYFLYFGRLAKAKGVATLIEAAKKTGARLMIAGTGPDEEALKAQAGNSDSIKFLGYRSGDDLHQLIREARAVVLPSECYENAPISVLESGASGKPVIGANIGGIPEMVLNGETGLLFDSGNSDSLTESMNILKNSDDSSIQAMGKNAREHVSKNYTRDLYLSKMQNLYDGLLAR